MLIHQESFGQIKNFVTTVIFMNLWEIQRNCSQNHLNNINSPQEVIINSFIFSVLIRIHQNIETIKINLKTIIWNHSKIDLHSILFEKFNGKWKEKTSSFSPTFYSFSPVERDNSFILRKKKWTWKRKKKRNEYKEYLSKRN